MSLSADEYVRCMVNAGFDNIGRRYFVTMIFRSDAMEEMNYRANQEDSQRAIPSLEQYVLLQWHFRVDHIMSDYSIFRRVKYHQDEISIACPLGKRQAFQCGERDTHRSWLFMTTEGRLGAIRSKLIPRNCFNLSYKLVCFGVVKFGHQYKWKQIIPHFIV